MKLVTYLNNGREQLAFCIDGNLYDTNLANPELPATMAGMLEDWERWSEVARKPRMISGPERILLCPTEQWTPQQFLLLCQDQLPVATDMLSVSTWPLPVATAGSK